MTSPMGIRADSPSSGDSANNTPSRLSALADQDTFLKLLVAQVQKQDRPLSNNYIVFSDLIWKRYYLSVNSPE